MSLTGDYDPENIFARIVRGEVPAARVFEDQDTLAFMDAFPQARGHVLVIHKRSQARNLLEASPAEIDSIMATVGKVSRAIVAALAPDGLMVSQFNGTAAGQTIFHLHFHLIPRREGVPLGRHGGGGMADGAELQELARRISARVE